MAILEDVPGVEVIVQIAGRDAIEYDADDEVKQSLAERTACPTVTKYIECIDDVEFAIKVTAGRVYGWGYQNHVLRIGVDIDGDWVRSKTILGPGERTLCERYAFCPRSQQWKSYKFKFSAVSITDDPHEECLEKDSKVVKQLGLIRVTVQRGVILPRRDRPVGRLPVDITRKFELSAKSLKGKAISHGTAFSAPRVRKAPRCSRSGPLPGDNGPIAVFNFLYRSKEALHQNLVIPRHPAASPSSTFPKLLPADVKPLEREDLNWKKTDEGLKDDSKPIKRKFKQMATDESPKKRLAEFIDLTID